MKNIYRSSGVILLVVLIHSCTKDEGNISNTMTDIDNNIYKTVTLDKKVWMKENLKTTRYNDGSAIPNVTENIKWATLTTHGYCWYNNDQSTYKADYGILYNWYAVNTGKLCPTGWHVPTDAEWIALTSSLSGESIAGGKLKEENTSHWTSPNTGATNETGFTALPGGARSNGGFASIGTYGVWWTNTEYSPTEALYWVMAYNNATIKRISTLKSEGFSVRCVK